MLSNMATGSGNQVRSTSFLMLLVTCVVGCVLGVFAQAEAGEALTLGRSFGKGHPFLVTDLPDSTLRRELDALPAEVRATAMAKLSNFAFHQNDVNSLHADSDGGIYVSCALTANAKAFMRALKPTVRAVDPGTASASVPVANPPIYHSKSGATRVIFLDFNGQVITGTAWNSSEGVSSWTAKPFDTDGDPTTFSDAEQTAIRRIWERVAEDYAPFDVDVTTQSPATFTANTGRVLITASVDANGKNMPAVNAGGVAYIDVFGASNYVGTYSPAFVYYDNLSSQEDYIAEASSHEMGHNLGLSHDGTAASEYYDGHGTGNTSWSPIMGAGYGRNVSQWSKGEYRSANNTEDDLTILTTHLPYRSDDHGNTNATATPLTVTGGTTISKLDANNHGIIERNTDVDVFSFTTGAGTISFAIKPWRSEANSLGGNLDILAELYNAAGALVASNDSTTDTMAAITYAASAGTYYLQVKPVGSGSPLSTTPTGYTSYGSLGQYFIDGTIVGSAPSQPNLAPIAPSGWSAPIVVSNVMNTTTDSATLLTTDTLYVDFAFTNLSQTAVTNVAFTTTLSVDGTVVKTVTQPAVLGFSNVPTVDFNIGSLSAGGHTLTMTIDTGNTVAESNEADNVFTKTITVTTPVVGQSNLAPISPVGWSAPIVVSKVQGTNTDDTGLLNTDSLYVDFAYANLSASFAANAAFTVQVLVDGTVVKTVTQAAGLLNATVPTLDVAIGTLGTGTHTILLLVDSGNTVAESNENDNSFTKTITVSAPNVGQPNLSQFTPVGWSDAIVVSTSTGTATDAATLLTTDTLYVDFSYANFSQTVSTAAAFDSQLLVDGVVVKTVTQAAGLGFFYIPTLDVNIGSLSAGTHTLTLKIDSGNTIAESNEADNIYTKTITVTAVNIGQPNLTYNSSVPVIAPSAVIVGSTVTIGSSVINNGSAAATTFSVRYRLSTDTVYSSLDDIYLGDAVISSLAAGASTTASIAVTIPSLADGSYYLVWSIDPFGEVAESNEADNYFNRPIPITVGTVVTNSPPVINSGPSFSPNAPVANSAVTFSVAASDVNGDALTYTWNFGDGGSGSGTGPLHTYTSAGTYTASVTVSDGKGGTATGSVSVTVSAGTSVKNAVVYRKLLGLNFARSFSDSFQIMLGNSDFYSLIKDGTPINVFVGNQLLDSGSFYRGRAFGNGTFTFSSRSGTINYSVSGESLQSVFAQYGATNATNFGTTLNIPVTFQINGVSYGGTYSFYYVAKAGRSGRAY